MQHLQPGTLLQGGRYRIESLIGGGGFGNTYVATNTAFGDRVAIKEFFIKGINEHDDTQSVSVSNAEHMRDFQEQKEKFKKEALRLRRFHNPNIVRVHDLFEENNTVYYVMDFIDGESLSARMKRTNQPLSEAEVRQMLPQILSALQSVHDAALWHLDLKPGNIMVDSMGNILLIDFGASKQVDRATGGATALSRQQKTDGYAPPEQMEENFRKYGPWTDIYALGATLYSLLTKSAPPVSSDINDDETPDKHIALPFPSGVSEQMRQAVLWMMNTNRTKRPQSIAEIEQFFQVKTSQQQEQETQPSGDTPDSFDDATTFTAQQHKPESKSNVVDANTEVLETSISSKKPELDRKSEDVLKTEPSMQPAPEMENPQRHGKSKKWLIVFIIALLAVLALLGIIGAFFLHNKSKKAPQVTIALNHKEQMLKVGQQDTLFVDVRPENIEVQYLWETGDSGIVEVKDHIVKALKAGTDSVVVRVIYKKDTLQASCKYQVEEEKKPEVTKKSTPKASTPASLSYGTYSGDRNADGQPHGFGDVTFTRGRQVNSQYYAERGYTIRNARFVNGKLMSGTLYDSDNNRVGFIDANNNL